MPFEVEQGALRDILRHIELAERFTLGHTFESFKNDELHVYAVTRCLEVISEASRRLSNKLKARLIPASHGKRWLEREMFTATTIRT